MCGGGGERIRGREIGAGGAAARGLAAKRFYLTTWNAYTPAVT